MGCRVSPAAIFLLGLAPLFGTAGCVGPRLGTMSSGSGGASGTGGSGDALTIGNTRRLRRLSNHEYDNVVRDLLQDGSQPSKDFIVDSFQNGYDNGSVGLAVQSDQVEGYQLAAETLAANAVANRLPALLAGCAPATSGEPACEEAFLASFAPRAFRRPLTDDELGRLRAVYTVGAQAGGLAGGVELVLETILQSPEFLYREELGAPEPAPGAPDEVQLTPYEVASELSFLMTGSMPDDLLFAAVTSGQFVGPDDHRREALRLLATPAAIETMRRFLHQWLATDRLADTRKDAGVYPAFNVSDGASSVGAAMASELDQDFVALVSQGTGSLRELFGSSQSFVDPALAALYDVAAPAASGFASVALDPALRRGVLTRLGYLTVHADQDSSGPIARGVFLMSAILCLPAPQRPATVPSAPSVGDANGAGLTTRQRFTQHLSDACRGCHKLIDGYGFGFEEFDGIGVHRTSENGNPVDSSGEILGTGDIDGAFDGVAALEDQLVQSHHLTDCFVRQMYRFGMGQVEGSDADDVALLADLGASFSVDSRMTDLWMAMVGAPAFTLRRTVMVEP
ncbi:MAG TPA: DUF1592 domain-containing protein [Polyangia bacterium]|jgi:hypothetical protein